jgi:hypothetical protein
MHRDRGGAVERSRYSQRDLVGRQIGAVCAELDDLGFGLADCYVREQFGERDYCGAHCVRDYCRVENGFTIFHIVPINQLITFWNT